MFSLAARHSIAHATDDLQRMREALEILAYAEPMARQVADKIGI
jgi:hypothetical protein